MAVQLPSALEHAILSSIVHYPVLLADLEQHDVLNALSGVLSALLEEFISMPQVSSAPPPLWLIDIRPPATGTVDEERPVLLENLSKWFEGKALECKLMAAELYTSVRSPSDVVNELRLIRPTRRRTGAGARR